MRQLRARTAALATQWPRRRIGAALLAATALALAVGVPTGVVPTRLYSRMTPVQWWNYPVWALTAVLGGLVVATYIRRPADAAPRSGAGAAYGGGLLAAFAVGCPVCNKLVVATVGMSGAMTFWAPLQPVLGGISVAGLAWVLRRRIRNEYACSTADIPRSADSALDDQHRSFGATSVNANWHAAVVVVPAVSEAAASPHANTPPGSPAGA